MKANIEVKMIEPSCAALDFFPFEGLAKIAHSKKLLPTFYRLFLQCVRFVSVSFRHVHADQNTYRLKQLKILCCSGLELPFTILNDLNSNYLNNGADSLTMKISIIMFNKISPLCSPLCKKLSSRFINLNFLDDQTGL